MRWRQFENHSYQELMTSKQKLVFFITFLIGIVVPFVPKLAIIEVFFLIIPFAIAFIITLIMLIFTLFKKNRNRRDAIFTFLIIPIFVLSQFFSGFIVDKIQRIRCESLINEIEKKTENLPENYDLSFGIEYKKLKHNRGFELKYSKGFLVTEIYNSENKSWTSYGLH